MKPEPLDEATAPAADRYCDLVLTGGVTDGVVYPWAVVELARHYHFKNIGGTSVGAMAAALTAAAEYGRRRGYLVGFNEVMMQIPERLAAPVEGVGTRIFSLFQPAKSTERLFELFVEFFSTGALSLQSAATTHIGTKGQRQFQEPASLWKKVLAKLHAMLASLRRYLNPVRILLSVYRGAASLGAAIGLFFFLMALGFSFDGLMAQPALHAFWVFAVMAIFIGLPLIAFWALLCVLWAIRHDILYGLLPNHYGMCTGRRLDQMPEDRPALVDWLHEGIQLAAVKPENEPLTFGDLWNAPAGPRLPDLPASRRKKGRSIDLHMITTNVTHGRPYEFPVDRDTPLFFRPCELSEFFPAAVMNHLVAHSLTSAQARELDHLPPAPEGIDDLYQLPIDELPVVVAARLSLSFPFLFSAVPLWEIDRESPNPDHWRARRCRFSDGGICSNFPIHMFDAAVPEWPTFGIALESRSVFRPNKKVWLTQFHDEGRWDTWFRFDEDRNPVTGKPASPSDKLLGFVGGIFYSAKDWNDRSAMRLPGVRDRIAHVTLEHMGGLNLRITGQEIMALAGKYGAPAGRKLARKFIDQHRNRPAPAWEEHRWVRFNTFLAALRERIEAIRDATENRRYGEAMTARIQDATRKAPLAGPDPAGRILKQEEADDLARLLESLQELERLFAQASLPQPYRPIPTPGLHVRAPL